MIKTDINLMPQKKKIPLSVTLGILFGIIALAALIAVGIAIPSFVLKARQAELDKLNQDLAAYGDVDAEYMQKVTELNTLKEQQANYTAFENTDRQTLELMQQIIAVTPKTVTVTDQSYLEDTIVVIGHATSNIEIARFEVALRKTGLFSDILLGTITGPDNKREFDFLLTHKVPEGQAEGGAGNE